MKVREAFGRALRQVRLQKGWSQEDFSGVSSRTNVSLLERGGTSPTLEKLESLCSVLGVHPVSLLAITYLCKGEQGEVDEFLTDITQEVKALLAEVDDS